METPLVTSETDAQRMAQGFGKSFEEDAQELQELYEMLRIMPLGKHKVEVAIEAAQKAQRYLNMIDSSEPREIATNLDKAHKIFVRAINKWRKVGEYTLKLSKDTRSDWEIERRRLNEEERRKREQQVNLFAAQARAAEVKHLEEIGKEQEAAAKAAEPLQAITVPFDPDAGKPDGEVMVEVWVPKRDESGEIVFSDLTAYLTWIAANPPMHHLVKHQYAKIKKLLTDHRGMLQPPGLQIEHKFEPRTRREEVDE